MAALMVWQGGFLFYTAFVVPIGTEVLGSALRQGFITRQVTVRMNACGAVALALMAWDLFHWRSAARLGNRVRVGLYVLMVSTAVTLAVLHGRLDGLLDVENRSVVDREAFRFVHRAYLWVSSGQWACAVAYLVATLAVWQREDLERVAKEEVV
jgi:hypothetical protein